MVKAKKKNNKGKGSSSGTVSSSGNTGGGNTGGGGGGVSFNNNNMNSGQYGGMYQPYNNNQHYQKENLDDLAWLRECELRHGNTGEPYLQLEYHDDDELILILHRFLEESAATVDIVETIYQIWQQTVLSTLLQSSAVWKKDNVTPADQRQMKDNLKTARYKINFIMHHVTGSMLTNPLTKWQNLRSNLLDMCYNTLHLIPRLAESCPHHKTDIRLCIIHFEGKEFLAAVACETWDTLYDYSVQIDPVRFIPILRRCAMLDVLDKDWNMLGGWEDILKGIEAKCCSNGGGNVQRLQSDQILHETTTILRNARNSMQCKFFSVRFMRYTEDQAPQRWRYFPKCSAPTCSNIETPAQPHQFRCKNCWYFHYCSPSCQEYCDNIMGLHPKFCKDTPAAKSSLCQKETEQYLGWTVTAKTDELDILTCHACGAVEEVLATNMNVNNKNGSGKGASSTANGKSNNSTSQMKRCQQCQAVCYCSRRCQEWDWKIGGHRESCRPVTSALSSTTSTAVTVASTSASGGGGGTSTTKRGPTSSVNVKDLN
jgi:MYND finger